MNHKIKGFYDFKGEFLYVDIRISQEIFSEMADEDKMRLRTFVNSHAEGIFNILKEELIIMNERKKNDAYIQENHPYSEKILGQTSSKGGDEEEPESSSGTKSKSEKSN